MKYRTEIVPNLTLEFEAECPQCKQVHDVLRDIEQGGLGWRDLSDVDFSVLESGLLTREDESLVLTYYKKCVGQKLIGEICNAIRKALQEIGGKSGGSSESSRENVRRDDSRRDL